MTSKLEHDLEVVLTGQDEYTNRYQMPQNRFNVKQKNTFGGLLFYQALDAAYHTVKPEYKAATSHMYFLAPTRWDVPVVYRITRLRDSNSVVHREVKVFQTDAVSGSETLSMVLLVLFNLRTPKKLKYGPQPDLMHPVVRSETGLVGGNPGMSLSTTTAFFPFKSDSKGAAVFDSKVLDQKFVRNTVDDIKKVGMLETWYPKQLDPRTNPDGFLFSNQHYSDLQLHSATVAEREIFSIAKAVPYNDTTAVKRRNVNNYHLFLAYLSDHELLSYAPVLTGCVPYAQEAFMVTLDHAVYFHEPKHQTTCFDHHIVRGRILKGTNGQYTLQTVIYNKYGESVAVCIQEGLALIDNRSRSLRLPGVNQAIRPVETEQTSSFINRRHAEPQTFLDGKTDLQSKL